MRLEGKINLVIHGLIALGTNGAVVVAIWGNWFRSKLMPPSSSSRPHARRRPSPFRLGHSGNVLSSQGDNRRAWLPAQNCRVMLRGWQAWPKRYISTCGAVRAATICIQLQIEAANLFVTHLRCKAAWDGFWDFVPATMRHHIPIRFTPYSGTQ